jgi:hypothetical protein
LSAIHTKVILFENSAPFNTASTGARTMKKVFVAILVVLLVSLSCSLFTLTDDSDTPVDETGTPEEFADRFGGDVEEYTRPLALSDCTEIKAEYKKYYDIWVRQESGTPEKKMNTGYMAALGDRIYDLGCQ